jgi:hypothetical protein
MLTHAQEVWLLVKDWYKEKGLPVPLEEANACLRGIAQEKKEFAAFQASLKEPPPKKYYNGIDWKAYWDKKKAKGWVPKKKA